MKPTAWAAYSNGNLSDITKDEQMAKAWGSIGNCYVIPLYEQRQITASDVPESVRREIQAQFLEQLSKNYLWSDGLRMNGVEWVLEAQVRKLRG